MTKPQSIDGFFRFHAPTFRAGSLLDIDVDLLVQLGIKAVLLDMDNTLSSWRGIKIAADSTALVQRLHAAGMKLAVFSNNGKAKVGGLACRLGIDVAIANAGKPKKSAFIRAARLMGVPPAACCVVGDQLMTDIVGGNKAGFGATILVPPLSGHEWVFTKYNRMREAYVLKKTKQAPNKPLYFGKY